MDRIQIKQLAKEKLKGNFKLCFVLAFVITVLTIFSKRVLNYDSNKLLIYLFDLIIAVLNIIGTMLYLKIMRNKTENTEDFNAFKLPTEKLVNCVICAIVVWVLNLIVTNIILFVYSIISNSIQGIDTIFMILITLSTLMLSIYTRFSTTIILDKNYNVKESIKLSIKLVHGKFWSIIVFQLSFIGWFVLDSMAYGMASIYIIPYIGIAYTILYLKLLDDKKYKLV